MRPTTQIMYRSYAEAAYDNWFWNEGGWVIIPCILVALVFTGFLFWVTKKREF